MRNDKDIRMIRDALAEVKSICHLTEPWESCSPEWNLFAVTAA